MEVGAKADLTCLDLNAPSMVGIQRETCLSQVIFSASPSAVKHVFVEGHHLVCDGHHQAQEEVISAFKTLMYSLGQT